MELIKQKTNRNKEKEEEEEEERKKKRKEKMSEDAPVILDWKTFDFSKLVYGQPKKGVKGNYQSEVSYNLNGILVPLVFQGPMLRLPFGVREKKNPNDNNPPAWVTYSCDMSLTGVLEKVHNEQEKDEHGNLAFIYVDDDEKLPKMKQIREFVPSKDHPNQEVLEFTKFLQGLDKKNKLETLKNIQKWLKKSYSKETIDTFYKSIIKSNSLPEQYAPLLPCNCIYSRDTFITGFFDANGKQIREKEKILSIPKYAQVVPLIRTEGLWFIHNGLGMKFRCEQMMIFNSANNKFRNGCVISYNPGPPALNPNQLDDGGYETGSNHDDTGSDYNYPPTPSYIEPIPTGAASSTTSSYRHAPEYRMRDEMDIPGSSPFFTLAPPEKKIRISNSPQTN